MKTRFSFLSEQPRSGKKLSGGRILMSWVRFLAAVAFVLVGLGGSLYSGAKAIEANRIAKTGVLAEATVLRVDVEEYRTRENDMDVFKKRYREVVGYKDAAGQSYETALTVKSETEPRLKPGDRLEIRYSAADPSRAVEAHGSRAFRDAVAGAVFGFVFAVAALFLAMKAGGALTAIHTGAVVWGAGALVVLAIVAGLWSMRGAIELRLPAASPGEVIFSGGQAVTLPDMAPFTGRLRVEVGSRITITHFERGVQTGEPVVYEKGRRVSGR